MSSFVRVESETDRTHVLRWLSTVIGSGGASVHGQLLHVGLDASILVDSITAPTTAVAVLDKDPTTMECTLLADGTAAGLAHARLLVAAVLASPLPSGPGTRNVMFSALDDHSWIEDLATSAPDQPTLPGYELDFEVQCWRYVFPRAGHERLASELDTRMAALPDGVRVGKLSPADAAQVDAGWPYRSDHSLPNIVKMVSDASPGFGGLGVFVREPGGSQDTPPQELLVAWCLIYPNGAPGMLHTVENHRREGYAWLITAAATVALCTRPVKGEDTSCVDAAVVDPRTPYCYITIENIASQNLFEQIGYRRHQRSDWIRFSKLTA